MLATVFFALLFKIPKRAILSSSIIGGLGYAIYDVIFMLLGSVIMGYFLGTLFIAVSAEILARVKKMPATIFVIPGIVPLVPGSGLYFTMMYLVQQNAAKASQTGMKTMLEIIAMAMALVLTSVLTTGITAVFKRLRHK